MRSAAGVASATAGGLDSEDGGAADEGLFVLGAWRWRSGEEEWYVASEEATAEATAEAEAEWMGYTQLVQRFGSARADAMLRDWNAEESKEYTSPNVLSMGLSEAL